jgi:hypothetical protein
MTMKRKQMIVAVFVLSLTLALCGIAYTKGPPGHLREGGGPMGVSWMVRHNIMAQVLSELSGQSADTINQQLKDQRPGDILASYKIDPKAFGEAMRTKATALIKLLTDNGYLNAEQSSKVQEKMAEFAQRRQLMSLLIEKGITDGTITPEQAQMLRHKPH